MEQTKKSRPARLQSLYPDCFQEREDEFVRQRRARISEWPTGGKLKGDQRLGLALSGGGIRSATFCLGVLQAMARNKMLRCVDYLSTVSGGGYIGGFLGGLFVRHKKLAQQAGGVSDQEQCPCDDVEQWLAGNQETRMQHWLRENGRYLAPDGVGDLLQVMAVQVCHWVSIMVLMGLTVLAFFCSLNAVRAGLGKVDWGEKVMTWLFMPPEEVSRWSPWLQWQEASDPEFWWWSPLWLVAALFVLFTAAYGAALLMIPKGENRRQWLPAVLTMGLTWPVLIWWRVPPAYTMLLAAVALVSTFSLFKYVTLRWSATWEQRKEPNVQIRAGRIRSRLHQGLEKPFLLVFKLAVLCVALALLDSLGQSVYLSGQRYGLSWAVKGVVSATGLGLLLSLGDRLGSWLEPLQQKQGRFSWAALCGVIGFVGVGLFLLNVNILGHLILWRGTVPGVSEMRVLDTVLVALFCWGLTLVWGRRMGFLNRTSLQEMYGLRLARAYLGGSNPKRVYEGHSVTSTIAGDDLWLDRYRPYEQGGPLHLINTTFNEKFSARTQTQHKDRLGMSFTVGPAGVSVAPRNHAAWASPVGESICLAEAEDSSPQEGFAMFPLAGCDRVASEDGAQCTRKVENLSVGHWLAISGAAFGTGMGSHTRLGMSLLAGLANIRLGYWWDSHVSPGQRHRFDRRGRWSKIVTWLFPVQCYLLDEWFAKFQGPVQQRWYLSDGGHFENTGVYELLRRRVSHIVSCDCGEDHAYTFTDIANLVRKARIDLQADIRFVPPAWLAGRLKLPEEFFGLPETVTEHAPEGQDGHSPHAMLAVVRYQDTLPDDPDPVQESFSLVLFLKPTFSGDESLDLVQYRAQHQEFPQESTGDQFFDEAQWESYRKLGEHIGSHVLGDSKKLWLLQLTGQEVWRKAFTAKKNPTMQAEESETKKD